MAQVTPDGAVTTWKRLDKWSTPSYASIDQETFSIAVTPDPPVTPKVSAYLHSMLAVFMHTVIPAYMSCK